MLFSRERSAGASDEKSRLPMLIVLLGALGGVLLLLLGGGLTDESAPDEAPASLQEADELEQYRRELEERIRVLCESVQGVSGVQIAVTLECGYKSIYATEQSNGNEEYVIVGSGSSASALLLCRREPEIAGIGVVCCGGGNADVRRELLSLLSAAFHVSGNRIYITEAKR